MVEVDVAGNFRRVQDRVAEAAIKSGRKPEDITIVCASKEQPAEKVAAAFMAGARVFGENYLPEALDKIAEVRQMLLVRDDVDPRSVEYIRWHFIGGIQSNKARRIAQNFDYIHSLDSLKAVDIFNRWGVDNERPVSALVEINLGYELSKQGISPKQLQNFLAEMKYHPFVRVHGLMTVPPYLPNPEDSRPYFVKLRQLKEQLQPLENVLGVRLDHLSMGMSNDFEVAVEEGATMVRIGSAIFGER